MLLHMGDSRYQYDNPGMIAHILRRFPRLQLICAHMGGYSEWAEARACLKSENELLDCSSTSFAMSAGDWRDIIRYFGAGRVMFGSDFPMWDHKDELERFLALKLTEEERERIFHGTFEEHFH